MVAIPCSISMLMAAAFYLARAAQQTDAAGVVYLCPALPDHHDDEFIRRCERVRRQFILTSALCGLVVVSLIALMIWH